jgi:hypothetical protein
MSTWRAKSWEVIEDAFRAALAEGEIDPCQIQTKVEQAYPFGERKYHPYKQWRKAMAEFNAKLPAMIELFSKKEKKP